MTQRDTPESENSFARLLDQARAGSREALGEVLKAFEYVLEKKARRFHRSGALRSKWGDSDLVQSTFLDAQRSFRQFRGRTEKEFAAWLDGIMTHNAKDLQRSFFTGKRQAKRELSLDDERTGPALKRQLVDDTPSSAVSDQEKEIGEALRAEMQKLPPDYARVIRLHRLERLTFEQIGRELGCSAEAARKVHFRAMRQLAKAIPHRRPESERP